MPRLMKSIKGTLNNISDSFLKILHLSSSCHGFAGATTREKYHSKSRSRIFVGMSGGVDSSVSAALLKEQGYDVTGVFIKVWQPDFMPCSWKEERRDAMRVAAHLDIPFITLDLEKEYKQEVVDYMIDEYKKGRTPNPDVMCNRYVKFGGFYDWAMDQGADFVATGHYARVQDGALLAGKDHNKDQSYFLWTLTKEKLSKTLFPVGDIEKTEVRRLAEKFKLPNATKKDSQGLCFVGKIDMKDFLKNFMEGRQGDVLNAKGEVIGHHEGALFYTLGERHGFTITKKTPDDKPYFVIAKDNEKNTLTVSSEKHSDNEDCKMVPIKHTNWIREIPNKDTIYKARVRYRGTLHEVRINVFPENETEINFINSLDVIAPGQSIVVYQGESCLGGGIIQ
jgi:tRNA-specific 2-thiouridylase